MTYTRANYAEESAAPAEEVWVLLGTFNCLPVILPKLVAKSEMDRPV